MTTEATGPAMSPLRRATILATVTFATALYAMTITVANVSLPQIQGALSATQDQIALIVTFNIVATAVATPTTGWLVARFGQRNVMLWSVFGFTVATYLCGTAGGLGALVGYRIAQGACGAPLVPLAQAIALSIYPRERHGMVTAVYGMGVVLGPIFAPTIGGYLSEAYNWRWVFYMIVPSGVLCYIGIWIFIQNQEEVSRPRLDWTGFLALSIGIACFQLMLDRGERNNWFESSEIVAEAVVAVAALYIFVVHTFTTDRPFLSPRLLLDRNFTVGLLIVLVFGMLNFTPLVLLPPLLQTLQGYPDSIIGLLLGTRAVGTMAGFMVMMFVSRTDPRIWLVVGFALQGVAGLRMAHFNIEVSIWDVGMAGAIQGLGVGLLWVPVTLVCFRTLSPALLPEGTAIFHLLRNIGSSIHISLSVAVVIHTAKMNYGRLVENISPYNENLSFDWILGGWSTESPIALAALGGEIQRQAAMIGYVNAFYMYALTSLAVIPLIFLVGRRKP